jgi:hypothetical protein
MPRFSVWSAQAKRGTRSRLGLAHLLLLTAPLAFACTVPRSPADADAIPANGSESQWQFAALPSSPNGPPAEAFPEFEVPDRSLEARRRDQHTDGLTFPWFWLW